MVKKGYLLAIVILVIVLVGIMIIVKKPKSPQEYFETGFDLYKNVDISTEKYRMMSPEEKEEYRKMVISSADSAVKSYQKIIDRYPNENAPKEIFNNIIECINIYEVQDDFDSEGLERITIR